MESIGWQKAWTHGLETQWSKDIEMQETNFKIEKDKQEKVECWRKIEMI